MENLNILCAELGRQLADIPGMEEKIINAALTVLEEQGPYAMFLYIKARHDKVADPFSEKSLTLLKKVFEKQLNQTNAILNAVKQLAANLDDLLFARDLLRTAFAYARYHLKAKSGGLS
jgi:hypothetical protein